MLFVVCRILWFVLPPNAMRYIVPSYLKVIEAMFCSWNKDACFMCISVIRISYCTFRLSIYFFLDLNCTPSHSLYLFFFFFYLALNAPLPPPSNGTMALLALLQFGNRCQNYYWMRSLLSYSVDVTPFSAIQTLYGVFVNFSLFFLLVQPPVQCFFFFYLVC